jgi:hypothetical protein
MTELRWGAVAAPLFFASKKERIDFITIASLTHKKDF